MSTYTLDQISQYTAEQHGISLKDTLGMGINWSETESEMINLNYMQVEIDYDEVPEAFRMEEEPIQF